MYKLIVFFFCLIYNTAVIEAHPGVGIVMDSKGNVFYTDLDHVWKISTSGEQSIVVRNVHTHELYIDEEDNLYGEHQWYEGEATDKWGNYVWCLGNDGIFEKTVQDIEGFLDNNTLVRDPESSTYWAEKSGDHEMLKKQTLSGQSYFVTEHYFDDIRWMYFSKYDNNLYVVDHLKIKKVTPKGDVTVIADNLKDSKISFDGVADRHYIFGMWSDEKKDLYVAIYGAGKVIKINTTGEMTTIFESKPFWSPTGGLNAPDGSQWIMEFSKRNKTRVRKISVDGKHTLYAN
ncbi:hypothetical protein [uncultured Eudoraea sp.]|uniref:hypothetical protein n=1 Tax=uncultured Eudoraea sp. TaxID=1035614 RepID=UPI002614CA14|nr:hypothetical protein [uncultured Eudoraea sp.]